MSTPGRKKTHPTLPDDNAVERYAKLTREGIFNLTPSELFWHARHRHLQDHGYILRPRYLPSWEPSWMNNKNDPLFAEDAIMLLHYQTMDATRVSSRELVAIKSFLKQDQELHIAQFFTSVHDPRNHCVPIYEMLPDPYVPKLAMMVMPYLRPCNSPEFATLGDVADFIDQTIEGLVFMHQHRVAHRDIAASNTMMDARALYPTGHHPVRLSATPDGQKSVSSLPRSGRNVRYYFIDFGLSSRYSKGSSVIVIGDVGRAYVPELSNEIPYDAFKVDIFALGDLYCKEFEKKYTSMEFLGSLIEPMTQRQPELRPTIDQVLRQWRKTHATLNDAHLRWRLVPPNEPALDRVLNDAVAVAKEGVHRLKKLAES